MEKSDEDFIKIWLLKLFILVNITWLIKLIYDFFQNQSQSKINIPTILSFFNSSSIQSQANIKKIEENIELLIAELEAQEEIRSQEKLLIINEIHDFNLEQSFLNAKFGYFQKRSPEKQNGIYTGESSLLSQLDSEKQNLFEMLAQLDELIKTEPMAPEGSFLSIQDLQSHIDEAQEHHQKLIDLSSLLIPNLKAWLTDRKNKFELVSDKKSSLLGR